MANHDPRLLALDPEDNVLTATTPLAAGEDVLISDESVCLPAAIPLGHKVAARDIATGEKVIKYGAPIGSATDEIPRGTHVHTHNVKSDYLPTYQRGETV
ncbi:MAG: UxaA family hydrolase [Chthoniobacteraceae bacterium]